MQYWIFFSHFVESAPLKDRVVGGSHEGWWDPLAVSLLAWLVASEIAKRKL
jgi:hypothetical protein